MEKVAVDNEVFAEIILRLTRLEFKVNEKAKGLRYFEGARWIDAEIMCLLFNLSKRSLQNYRRKGQITYTHLVDEDAEEGSNRFKCYYNLDEIEKTLIENTVKAFCNLPSEFKF